LVGSDLGARQLRKAAGEAHARQFAAGKVHAAQTRTEELRAREVTGFELQPLEAQLRQRCFVQVAAHETHLLELCLGEVRDFARVYVNSDLVAELWSEPYRCDISKALRAGRNSVKVEVTSTWFNRLAYDFGLPPSQRKTWTIWDRQDRQPPCLVRGAELRPSGLLGPVAVSW
jgi:hypothetical protein